MRISSKNPLSWVVSVLVGWALGFVALPASAHQPGDEAKPAPPVSLRIVAPSAHGRWLLRVDNEGDEPLRIAADVRLLRFEITAPETEAPKPGRWRPPPKQTICDGPSAFGMDGNFPGRRELVLGPGRSYVEEFDPRLICFGKEAEALVPGARVKAYYGWKPARRWGKNKLQAAPFVADAAKKPRQFKPLKRLGAPTMVLSHAEAVVYGPAPKRLTEPKPQRGRGGPGHGRSGHDRGPGHGAGPDVTKASAKQPAKEAPKKPEKELEPLDGADLQPRSAEEASLYYRPRRRSPMRRRPPKDELGATMALTADHYADAAIGSDVSFSVQAHNVGERPVFVALRARMLSFNVLTPTGEMVRCERQSMNHHVPRDLFATLHHGKHKHMYVRLAEICPARTFARPGLYAVVPTLHADADGAEYGLSALTGRITVRDPGDVGGTHVITDDMTLVRITRGRQPAYMGPPRSMPTRLIADAPPDAAQPAPEPTEEADENP